MYRFNNKLFVGGMKLISDLYEDDNIQYSL